MEKALNRLRRIIQSIEDHCTYHAPIISGAGLVGKHIRGESIATRSYPKRFPKGYIEGIIVGYYPEKPHTKYRVVYDPGFCTDLIVNSFWDLEFLTLTYKDR